MKITVVKGDAHDLLAKDYAQYMTTGKYIDRLISKEVRGQSVPETTLYTWSRDYFDDGIDPIAPILRATENHVVIDGIALFNEDKYVGKIEPRDSVVFAFLRGDFRQGEFTMEITNEDTKQKEIVLFSSLIGERKISVERANGSHKFKVKIEMTAKGSILEYIGELTLSEEEQKKKLEKAISKYMRRRVQELVTYMQKVKADSLGLGKEVRNSLSYQEWSQLDWDKVYSKLEVECNFKVKIRDFGKFK